MPAVVIRKALRVFCDDERRAYRAWLDDVLEIRKTANADGFDLNYDLQVFDNP